MSEKRYDEKILHALLDRYERSLLYTGENRRNQTISFPVNRHTLPEYFDEASLQYTVIHEQLMDLESQGLVRLIWKGNRAGHILEKCLLIPEMADQIYVRLRRVPKREKEQKLLKICEAYQGKQPVLDRFLSEIIRRLEQGEKIGQYADLNAPETFENCCRLVFQILDNQEEIFLREFSIRYWQDSKTAEKETAKAAGIIAEFSENGELESLQTDQILEEYLIYRNPSYVMIKGKGCFGKTGTVFASNGSGEQQNGIISGGIETEECQGSAVTGRIALEEWPGGIGLSSQDIGLVRWLKEDCPKRVVTIENLTSFHRWNDRESLAVYLGGYHNRAKRSFLQNLYRAYPQAEYLHFGDIDCGGFQIWKDLCLKTGISFRTWGMDRNTYLEHLQYGKRLTEHDIRELKKMMEDPFFSEQRELFALMLEKERKVEQECVVNTEIYAGALMAAKGHSCADGAAAACGINIR